MLEMLLNTVHCTGCMPPSPQTKIYPVQNGNCNEFKKTCLSMKWNNSFVQTISLSFQSLVQAGEIYKTFPILDWNVNILYSFALIMFLHFRHIFKCYQMEECSLRLPDGCLYIICTWPSATQITEFLVFLVIGWIFQWNFARRWSFYYVIKCNPNDYTVSEWIEYTASLL